MTAPEPAPDARELTMDDCPADIIEFGMRHGIPEFARATWWAGVRAAQRHQILAYRAGLDAAARDEATVERVARALLQALHDQKSDGFVEMTGVLENVMIDGQFDVFEAMRAAIRALAPP